MSENSKSPGPEKNLGQKTSNLGPPPGPLLEPGETLYPIPKQGEVYTARLTLISTVYHQAYQEEPQAFSSQSDRLLDSAEQVYTRHLKVSQDWQALDFGWVKNPGMILLEYPITQVKVDTPISQGNLQLGVGTSEAGSAFPVEIFEIPPGDPFRGYPISGANTLYVRYPNGDGIAKVILHAFPR